MPEVHDSPNAWVADHFRRFEETGGQPRPGVNDLLLTTRGRKTGELRRTALVYGRDGDSYVLAASNRGADYHPAWYLNLLTDPHVTVQVGTETFTARARPATATERPHLWRLMVAAMPEYAAYQERTIREIPVVVLQRVQDSDSSSPNGSTAGISVLSSTAKSGAAIRCPASTTCSAPESARSRTDVPVNPVMRCSSLSKLTRSPTRSTGRAAASRRSPP